MTESAQLINRETNTEPFKPIHCQLVLYVSFLSDRKQRVVCHNTVCDWKDVNCGTTHGSVSGPYLFNLFLDDLDVTQYCQASDLTKYADDTSIIVTVRKNSVDETQKALNAFLEWTEVNGMSCNTTKYKELCMAKKGVTPNFPPLCGIEQSDSVTLLGVTLQNDCKFSSHVKGKLREAKNCLYIFIDMFASKWAHGPHNLARFPSWDLCITPGY